jgi:hypothetical protein
MDESNSQSEPILEPRRVFVDSKSPSNPYSHLDACQGMDGVWRVGRVAHGSAKIDTSEPSARHNAYSGFPV